MKLTIAKEQLLNGLQAVQNVVGSRTTLPILSECPPGRRRRAPGTDGDRLGCDDFLQCRGKVSVPGRTTVPVKKFFGIARELSALDLDIAVDDKAVMTLQAGDRFTRSTGWCGRIPTLPSFSQSGPFLPQEKLKAMLRKTSFAASTDEARYVLNGIFSVYGNTRSLWSRPTGDAWR